MTENLQYLGKNIPVARFAGKRIFSQSGAKVKYNDDFKARDFPHLSTEGLYTKYLLCSIFLLCDVLLNAYTWVQI